MPKSALGTKRHCQSCDGKFYDLNKTPIVCPSCGSVFDPEVLLKSRRVKPVAAAPVAAKPEVDENTDQEELDTDIDTVDDAVESDETVLEDGDDLMIVTGDSDDDENINGGEDMPIEDDLDAVEADDDEE